MMLFKNNRKKFSIMVSDFQPICDCFVFLIYLLFTSDFLSCAVLSLPLQQVNLS